LVSSPNNSQDENESQLLSEPRGPGVHYIHIDDPTEKEREQIRQRHFN